MLKIEPFEKGGNRVLTVFAISQINHLYLLKQITLIEMLSLKGIYYMSRSPFQVPMYRPLNSWTDLG